MIAVFSALFLIGEKRVNISHRLIFFIENNKEWFKEII